MVAETFRRGKLSEVMDLGGLSQLAESTVDTMRDGLALHDAEGQLVGWNPAAETDHRLVTRDGLPSC